MSSGVILASSKPFPDKVYLIDSDVDNGKPFLYQPSVDLWSCPIEIGYDPEQGMYEYDILSDLPKVLPKYIYFGGPPLGYGSDEVCENVRVEQNRNYNMFLAFINHMVEIAGDFYIIEGGVPSHTICSVNAKMCNVCVEYVKNNSNFKYRGRVIYHFVRCDEMTFDFDDNYLPNTVDSCCVTLLACPAELPDDYPKKHGMEFPSFGITTPYNNQHKIQQNEEHMGLEEEYRYLIKGISDLDKFLPSNIYISGLNPSYYSWGNACIKKERMEAILKLINYMHSIVNEQGEVWYIRQWIPDKVVKIDNIKIKTIKINDLKVDENEFEFELCVLYHIIK